MVLTDLDTSFPSFAGQSVRWDKVPDGQDPPDFIGTRQGGKLGLELIEWLDGEQMTMAKGRESLRGEVRRFVTSGWETEYEPKHFCAAFLMT